GDRPLVEARGRFARRGVPPETDCRKGRLRRGASKIGRGDGTALHDRRERPAPRLLGRRGNRRERGETRSCDGARGWHGRGGVGGWRGGGGWGGRRPRGTWAPPQGYDVTLGLDVKRLIRYAIEGSVLVGRAGGM